MNVRLQSSPGSNRGKVVDALQVDFTTWKLPKHVSDLRESESTIKWVYHTAYLTPSSQKRVEHRRKLKPPDHFKYFQQNTSMERVD